MGLQTTTHGREEVHDTVLKVEAEKEDPKA